MTTNITQVVRIIPLRETRGNGIINRKRSIAKDERKCRIRRTIDMTGNPNDTRHLRRAALTIARNENDPISAKWLDGVLNDSDYACYAELFRPNEPALQGVKRKMSVWVVRQAADGNNRISESQHTAIQEAVLGMETLEETERVIGPWWGTFAGDDEPRTRELDPALRYIPKRIRVAT